ncbi:MAG: hypothetical protein V9H26_12860 [Verrucomicrobiota bacterium]
MDLWQILGLGVVRLGLDADWNRSEDTGQSSHVDPSNAGRAAAPWGEDPIVFARQSLRDNVALVDDALLREINAQIAAAG